jgi:hypothetical protein
MRPDASMPTASSRRAGTSCRMGVTAWGIRARFGRNPIVARPLPALTRTAAFRRRLVPDGEGCDVARVHRSEPRRDHCSYEGSGSQPAMAVCCSRRGPARRTVVPDAAGQTLRLETTSAPFPPTPSVLPLLVTDGTYSNQALRCRRWSMTMVTSAKRSRRSRSRNVRPSP